MTQRNAVKPSDAAVRMIDSIDGLIMNLGVLKNEIIAINSAVHMGNLTENTLAENEEIYYLSAIKECNRKINDKVDRFSKIVMIANAFQKINKCEDFKKHNISVSTPKISSFHGKSNGMIVNYKFNKDNKEVGLEVNIDLDLKNAIKVGIYNSRSWGILNFQLHPIPGLVFNYTGHKKINVTTFCTKIDAMQADILAAYSYIMSLPPSK